MARIGVEESLTNVSDALRARGYEVVELRNENDAKGCDCCVVTGLDHNMMGIQNTSIKGPVLNAHGLNADEVCSEVEKHLKQ
ncbi:YkuS family protein [Fictibacillus sp. Mic-4]|uniref:YkuS family protein n=1 Tax=Fictibacillus TaxID=1329200 RepID=UPI00042762FC|nr:YkuS family protein [Fictibacillus gelatini]